MYSQNSTNLHVLNFWIKSKILGTADESHNNFGGGYIFSNKTSLIFKYPHWFENTDACTYCVALWNVSKKVSKIFVWFVIKSPYWLAKRIFRSQATQNKPIQWFWCCTEGIFDSLQTWIRIYWWILQWASEVRFRFAITRCWFMWRAKFSVCRWKILDHFLQSSSLQNNTRIGAYILLQGTLR